MLVKAYSPVAVLKALFVEPEMMVHKSVRGLEIAIAHE